MTVSEEATATQAIESNNGAVLEPPRSGRDNLEWRAMRAVGSLMERAPWTVCRSTGAWLGMLFFAAIKRRREIAVENIRLAFPGVSDAAARQIARRSAQNFAMMFCEFLHMRSASPEEIHDYVGFEGLHHFQDALGSGRGAIFFTIHLGNWELMGARYAQEAPLTVVARPSSNNGIERYIREIRQAGGMNVISKHESARGPLKVLRANQTLGILPDQHAGPEGVLIPLFGHPTRFIGALARLALLSRAPVVPAFGIRQGPWLRNGRIVAQAAPAFCLEAGTDKSPAARDAQTYEGTCLIARHVQEIVSKHPEQWLWMHRRWRPEDRAIGKETAAS